MPGHFSVGVDTASSLSHECRRPASNTLCPDTFPAYAHLVSAPAYA